MANPQEFQAACIAYGLAKQGLLNLYDERADQLAQREKMLQDLKAKVDRLAEEVSNAN